MTPELALQATPEDLRANLAIPYVLRQYRHHPASMTGSRYHYHSPFRKDDNPSFDVWITPNGEWRCGDFAEGWSGSVIDLLERLEGGSAIDNIIRARDLLAEQIREGYVPQVDPAAARAPKELPAGTEEALNEGRNGLRSVLTAHLGEMVQSRPGLLDVKAEDLDGWRLSADGNRLLIPNWDEQGALRSVKQRTIDGAKKNAPGSTLYLYGAWRLPEWDGPVLLVEGESDAWAAQHHLPDHLVVAIPGTGKKPEHTGVTALAGRHVVIAFDGDAAGRLATNQWAQALASEDCVVSVVAVPEGKDLAGLPGSVLRTLPSRARPVQPPPTELATQGHAYVRVNGGGGVKPITNWVLRVEKLLRGVDGGLAFEGTVLPHGRREVLPAEALASQSGLVRWCNQFGGIWTGGASDHQRLMQLLLADSTWVPEGRMTRQVGYHDGDFVWPGGHIGTDEWTYVPPASKINLAGRITIRPAPVDPVACVDAMLKAHSPSIVGPILAWLAVAPIRPMFDRFPILSISGVSGSGKTTLTEKLLRSFSGSDIATNLTSTTPYAVTAFFASSNAVPVWFDEYRPGARADAMAQLDQLLRDCYTGQPSYKGGMSENKAEVVEIPTVVPVVVTGEDSFQETSHTDRMVLVRLTKRGQGDIGAVDGVDCSGFAHAYLTWLLTGEAPVVSLRVKQYPGLNERQCLNLEVLKYGWHLLQSFLSEHDPSYRLPSIDLTSVVTEAVEAAASNPLMDAVRWALETTTFLDAVWSDGEWVYVHPVNLLSEARKTGAFVLPTSNAKGVRALLRDQYGGTDERIRKDGKHVRVVRIPLEDVVQ